jgi:hypothetical protein
MSYNASLSASNRTKVIFADLTLATLVMLGIFWMPLYFYSSGITITTYIEESVGYRYFYSLRLAFGGEGAWLPQGQLVTLYHTGLQRLLSFFGLPNDQLFPRIDIFCALATILPIILTGFAFYKLSSSFSRKIWPALIGAIFVFAMASEALPGGRSWTLMPDYHVWLIPLALLSGWLLPNLETTNASTSHKPIQWFVGMGLLMGLAAGIKITFILFPLTVLGLWVFKQWRYRKTPLYFVFSMGAFFLTIALIVWACTGFGGWLVLQKYLLLSKGFFQAKTSGMTPEAFSFHIETFLPLCFSILLFGWSLYKKQWSLMIIVIGVGVYTKFAYSRYYSHSLIEYHAFVLIPLVLFIRILANSFLYANISTQKRLALIVLCSASIVFAYTMQKIWPSYLRDTPNCYRLIGQAASEFHQSLAAGPGSIWILTTDNSYRPLSIESALCKGGMDVSNPQWGSSPYIASLFPRFHCAVFPAMFADRDRKQIPYSTIGFSHWANESLPLAISRVEKAFGISLSQSQCHDVAGNYGPPYTYCYPKSYV